MRRSSTLEWARAVTVLMAFVLLSLGCTACGGQGRSAGAASSGGSSTAASLGTNTTYVPGRYGYVEGDRDSDDVYHGHKDEDDKQIRTYGHEAAARDLRAVVALVKRYYQAAAAGDTVRACSLMYAPIARRRDFASVVPEAYAGVADSSLFHNKTCTQVESFLFQLNHRSLTAGVAGVTVTAMRVSGNHGIALLGFKRIPEHRIAVQREHGRWTIDALLDSEIV